MYSRQSMQLKHHCIYKTIVSAWETITKTAVRLQSGWTPRYNTHSHTCAHTHTRACIAHTNFNVIDSSTGPADLETAVGPTHNLTDDDDDDHNMF